MILVSAAGTMRSTVVDSAPCMACKAAVEVTDFAMDAFVTLSKILRARGELPLDMASTFCCPACAKVRESVALERSAARAVRTTRSVRVLKGVERASEADRTEATKWLVRVMGQGYVDELMRTIEEKRSNGGAKPRKGEV